MVVWTVPTVFQNSSVADPVSCLCQNEHRQRDFANRANGKRFNINRCEPPSEQRTTLLHNSQITFYCPASARNIILTICTLASRGS